MILSCPNCQLQFRIDPAALGEAGRRVRCSSCGHRWLAKPLTAQEAEKAEAVQAAPAPIVEARAPERVEPVAPPTPKPMVPPAPRAVEPNPTPAPPLASAPTLREPSAGRKTAAIGWLVLVLLLLVLAGAVIGRNEVASAFPVTAPLYQKVGLPITVRSGLEFRNLGSRRVEEQSLVVFVVEGEIHNISGSPRRVPAVRVALLDSARNEVDFGLFDPPERDLAAGTMTRFEARLVDPPVASKSFRVTFEANP